ncbi:hypothetical protein WJ968_26815 [Achromobacter xylosoxidans]
MKVLFVAQCSKRALTETRRILDQYAERRGDRTWQMHITRAGLNAVRRLLRQRARKNTAVACHRIRAATIANCCGSSVMRASSTPWAPFPPTPPPAMCCAPKTKATGIICR